MAPGDIRVEVPILLLLTRALRALWPNHNDMVLGRNLAHSVLCQAILGADDAEMIADQVMRMLPDLETASAAGAVPNGAGGPGAAGTPGRDAVSSPAALT
jgi:hypothetical protein